MTALAERFLALHDGPAPLLLPNPWDAGSARILQSLGFQALATTSSGFAASVGKLDHDLTRDESLAHAAAVVAAVDLPVSADLEDGFGDTPEAVAETVRLAADVGLAGCSIEDADGSRQVYDLGLARERVAAAVEASDGTGLVLTARAENFIVRRPDLADTVTRLQAYQEAGAEVLFAPGLVDPDGLRSLLAEVDRPVSVLVVPGCPSVAELGELGVARISVGGGFAYGAYAAAVAFGRELLADGTYGYLGAADTGRRAVRDAFR